MKAFLGGLLAGLIVGALLMTIAGRVIDSRRDHWPNAVMTILDHEFRTLRRLGDQGQCATAPANAALERLRLLAQDVEPALLPADGDDRVFRQYASDLRSALDKVATAGADCKLAATAITDVRGACQACHRDYR